jgi:hypothetical protein
VRSLGGLRDVVYNKFYVDEIYDAAIVRPYRWIARATYNVIDRFLIDTVLVNGPAVVVGAFGRLTRAWQNGDVQRYLLAMLIGFAAIFYFATRSDATFTTTQEPGTTVRFNAEIGDGVERRASKVEWDFTGDDVADSTDAETTWTYAAPGEYSVLLRVTDVFGRTREQRQTVKVGGQP